MEDSVTLSVLGPAVSLTLALKYRAKVVPVYSLKENLPNARGRRATAISKESLVVKSRGQNSNY